MRCGVFELRCGAEASSRRTAALNDEKKALLPPSGFNERGDHVISLSVFFFLNQRRSAFLHRPLSLQRKPVKRWGQLHQRRDLKGECARFSEQRVVNEYNCRHTLGKVTPLMTLAFSVQHLTHVGGLLSILWRQVFATLCVWYLSYSRVSKIILNKKESGSTFWASVNTVHSQLHNRMYYLIISSTQNYT